MDGKTAIELVGYLGSALVVVSMLMTSVVRLRIINLIGCVIFTCYALVIRSYPTAAMNIFLVCINIYHLVRLGRNRKHYNLIKTVPDDGYVSWLRDSSLEAIRVWNPGFSLAERKAETAYLVCCDGNPAGLFLACPAQDGSLEVLLDYATPVYRDTSVGSYLHEQLASEGYKTLVFRGNAPKHAGYMEKVGDRTTERGDYDLKLN